MSAPPSRGSILALSVGALIGAGVGFYYLEQERQRVQAKQEETRAQRLQDLKARKERLAHHLDPSEE
ncbi:hypothetical protein BJ684DRAFT_18309 [Piptocephalis cylindrospora]|uniref:Uncharacterized protein n=1 Tax=Piptocephalis cylindrospora TaxID=1907219 RepID=A0A4P9Y894_9FUNG|nr:hypothetical protein BJ684DRAFT_18309 [Piptocephalis cylindrospora]|eukprot:RKP15377.1 hypothetical protein BJ684DRAFT_18309 [Piptocephalis cylindrospora]